MQEENNDQDYGMDQEFPQVISDEGASLDFDPTDAEACNPLDTISDSDDFCQMPTPSEQETDQVLSLNSLTNEEIDARLQKLGDELEERWQKRNNMIKDLERLGPAPSRVEILTKAIVDEFETAENAIGFVKMLVTKGGLTPQQKIIEVARVGINIVGKLIEGVKEIRKRDAIVGQQIAIQGEIVVKTDEVKVLTATKTENIQNETGSNIQSRHEEANASINQAVDRISSNSSEIDEKFSDYEAEREDNMNNVEENGFNNEVSSRLGGLLDDINNI